MGGETLFKTRAGKLFQELPKQDDPHFQSLLLFTLSNNFAFHWQVPTDGSPYSFRQFIYDGHEQVDLHQVLRNLFPPDHHPVVAYMCEGNKRRDECQFGQFDVKMRLLLSSESNSNQVPFYLQPTLGGTDIDGRVTLRGWDNYRFRAPDLSLFQFEYGIPVYDLLGVFVFYDAGTVGNSTSDLAISRIRQDAGFRTLGSRQGADNHANLLCLRSGTRRKLELQLQQSVLAATGRRGSSASGFLVRNCRMIQLQVRQFLQSRHLR